MANDETVTEFKAKFYPLLKNLREHGEKDSEVIWLIGSLASEICAAGNKANWPLLKAKLNDEAYDSLINKLIEQGNKLSAQDKDKAAYAAQILISSTIASRMADEDVQKGNQLLDGFITKAIGLYQQSAAATAAAKTAKPH